MSKPIQAISSSFAFNGLEHHEIVPECWEQLLRNVVSERRIDQFGDGFTIFSRGS